jgi:hypothetical protein
MSFTSFSQAGQDVFVHKVLEGKTEGVFLDVGAGHPVNLSNTYALEQQFGWRGYLIEQNDIAAQMLRTDRKSAVLQVNALTVAWRTFEQKDFDYISLDVDYISHKVLLDMLVAGITARVWTIEHNEYSYPDGGSPAWVDRVLMAGAKGYELIAENVTNTELPFENWYVDRLRVNMDIARKFTSTGRDGTELANSIL